MSESNSLNQPLKHKDYYEQAQRCLQDRQFDEAQTLLTRSLGEKKTPQAYCDLADLHVLKGKANEAIVFYEAALKLDPRLHKAQAQIATLLATHGHVVNALDRYSVAIKIAPDVFNYKQNFIDLLAGQKIQAYSAEIKNIVLICLNTKRLDVSPLAATWHSLLKYDPAFKLVFKAARRGSYSAFKENLKDLKTRRSLLDPFFLAGLKRLIVTDREFENMLTFLQRLLLENADGKTPFLNEADYNALTYSLSFYALATEYIFNVTPEEATQITLLKERVEAENDFINDIKLVLILSLYMPMRSLANAPQIADQLRSSSAVEFPEFVEIHLDEFLKQESLLGTIPALSPIENKVSSQVRSQYEEFPYPQWRDINTNIRHEACEGYLVGTSAKILVAGCGTGREAIELAAAYPGAQILAIDLSLTSLSYALRRAKGFGLENIRFAQADILSLDVTGQKYDFIASSGVIHHMEYPEKGLAVLVSLLKSGGTMRLALYSEIARRCVVEARTIIEQAGYKSSADEIRRFRHDASDILPASTLDEIANFRDYYNLSECRDLLFHVHEHRYTLTQIAALLDRAGMKFLQFYLPASVSDLYRKAFPQDVTQDNLSCWADFEEKHPLLFRGMYRFWCQKKAD